MFWSYAHGRSTIIEHTLKLNQIKNHAGPKAFRTVESQLKTSRKKYYEMNLNDGLRELPYIQPEMRDRILKHYLRQIRKYYVSKFLQFNKDMKEWNERQEANKSLRAVAGEFVTFAEDNLPPSFMKALHDPAPPPPTLCICMPEKMMAYILDLASMNVPVESGRYPAFTEVSPSQFPRDSVFSHLVPCTHGRVRVWSCSSALMLHWLMIGA